MSKEEIYKLKLQLKLKIFFSYFFIIFFSMLVANFIGTTTILILLPTSIIICNKLTEDDKIKLKSLRINSDFSPIHEVTDYQDNEPYNYDSNNKMNEINYSKYYKPRRYITTLNELHFYEVLLEIAKELDLVLFCQVSLYSIIEPKENLDYSTRIKFFNKINRKSIDFVLADKKTCRVRLCIELDDSTHNQKKRIKRDEFLDQLFKQLEINLLRYPVYSVYYKETLKNKVLQNMKESTYQK